MVTAQVSVDRHVIVVELGEGLARINETFLFVNPSDSEVHTFDDEVPLIRDEVLDFTYKGLEARLDNDSSPSVIYLDFSKKPLIRSAANNRLSVELDYSSEDLVGEIDIGRGNMEYVILDNLLFPTPPGITANETVIILRTASGLTFGPVLPVGEISGGEISYSITKDQRKNFPAFNVEAHYGRYADMAEEDLGEIDEGLKRGRQKLEDAETALLNAEVYDADTSSVRTNLLIAKGILDEVERSLENSKTLLSKDPYEAFKLTNSTLPLMEVAINTALVGESKGNELLRQALNQKIARLENLTNQSVPKTPPFTTAPPVIIVENKTPEKPVVTPTVTTTLPPTPETTPPIVEVTTADEGRNKTLLILLPLVLISAALVFTLISRKQKKRGSHKAGLTDYRSITDLKKRNYKDFEEKVVDVKKETTIAGDLRRHNLDMHKLELGLENLEKKKRSGEIESKIYNSEKRRYKNQIKDLKKKIKELEKELPVKGE